MRRNLKFRALRLVDNSSLERSSLRNRTTMSAISARMLATNAAFEAVKTFYFNSRYAERRLEPGICDFTLGKPHEMPLDGIVAAIRERAIPHDKNWFGYKTSEEDPK